MANFRYFLDTPAGPVQLSNVRHDGHNSTAAHHFEGLTPEGRRVAASRVIEYKANPSKHVCDDRCLHATGKTMRCECACGGKNHGRGAHFDIIATKGE